MYYVCVVVSEAGFEIEISSMKINVFNVIWLGVHKKPVARDSIEFDSKKSSVPKESYQLGFETN